MRCIGPFLFTVDNHHSLPLPATTLAARRLTINIEHNRTRKINIIYFLPKEKVKLYYETQLKITFFCYFFKLTITKHTQLSQRNYKDTRLLHFCFVRILLEKTRVESLNNDPNGFLTQESLVVGP